MPSMPDAGSIDKIDRPEKGFEHPGRLPTFAAQIARRAVARKGKNSGASVELTRESEDAARFGEIVCFMFYRGAGEGQVPHTGF
ncbi:MAG: hypothetical protein LV480_13105 [Methylacidiphilales bacterium]|nr:hypothetical protein [Candidatus Methylacidiphilales bacterium]